MYTWCTFKNYLCQVNEMAAESLKSRKSAKIKMAAAAAEESDDDFQYKGFQILGDP